MPRRSRASRCWKARGKKRSPFPVRTRVGILGQSVKLQADSKPCLLRGVGAVRLPRRLPAERRAGNRCPCRTQCCTRGPGPRFAAPQPSRCCPTMRRGSRPVRGSSHSRGQAGDGAFSHTSGAVNPPSDCATSTTSWRPPTASSTRRAYSGSPALSSSPGRSTATAAWPALCSSGTTRLQYQAAPPAPGIRTNPAHRRTGQTTTAGPRGRTGRRRPLGRLRFDADLISPLSPRPRRLRHPQHPQQPPPGTAPDPGPSRQPTCIQASNVAPISAAHRYPATSPETPADTRYARVRSRCGARDS